MELKDLVKYYVPMRMEGSSPPNWEVVFGYDISKFKGYNVDEVRVALNLTQLWLSQGPRVLTGQSHVDVATKCSLLKRSCKKKFLQKQVKQIVKAYSTWAEVLQRLEKMFPVYETDLSVRTQIEELPMLPEFPSAARISEYVCNLEYLFSRMNVGSYGATEPHLWLISKIPQRKWDDCCSTSERKSRTHSYDELVDLLIELLTRSRGGPGHGTLRWTRASEQAGKALRSQGHQCAHVM